MERLTEYRSGIATPVPELYLMAVQEKIPQENWNNYIIKKLSEKLARLEDLQDQGRLPELPCAVDSEIWYIDVYGEILNEIVRGVVDGYLWYRSCGFALNVAWDKPIMGHFGYKRKEVLFSEIGKTIFLTLQEAEEALERMVDGNEID